MARLDSNHFNSMALSEFIPPKVRVNASPVSHGLALFALMASGRAKLRGSIQGISLMLGQEVIYQINPNDERAAKAMCRTLLAPYDAQVIGVINVPKTLEAHRMLVGEKEWTVTAMRTGQRYRIPEEIKWQIEDLRNHGIIFNALLLGEEKDLPIPVMVKDPAIIGLIRLAPNRAVCCRLGEWDH